MEFRYSSIVLFLLEKKCPINSTRTWDYPDRLSRIGISVKPPFARDELAPCKKSSIPTCVPSGLSPSQTRSFVRFIHKLREKPEAKRLQFIDQKGGTEDAGRKVWKRWFRTKIRHHLHRAITLLYISAGVHPIQLMYRTGDIRVMFSTPDILEHVTIVGGGIFGPGVPYEGGNLKLCRDKAYVYLKNIVEIWWERSFQEWDRTYERHLPDFRASAQDAINGLLRSKRSIRISDIKLAQEKVNEFEKMARWYPEEGLIIETHKAILEGIWLSLGKNIERIVFPLAASLRMDGVVRGCSIILRGRNFADETEVESVWKSFVEYFSDLKPVFDSRPEWNAVMLEELGGND